MKISGSIISAVVFCLLMLVFPLTAPADRGGEDAGERPEMDGLTHGELPWEQAFDAAMLEGRKAYNSEDWERAETAFVEAIQVLPERAAPYRNLARVYNFMGRYRGATEYYDRYLRMAPEADDAAQIRQERRGTMSRAGDDPFRPPADQRIALRSLRRELDAGRGLTADGGGAWGLFQSLLDTGYAAQDIRELRHRLETKIGGEFEQQWVRHDQFLPLLDREQWKLQKERLDALARSTRNGQTLAVIEARRSVVHAALALLDGEFEETLSHVDDVVDGDDELSFARWYGIVALAELGRVEEALNGLDELLEQGVFDGEAAQFVEVVRGQLLQRLGEDQAAAETFRQALSP